MNFNPRSHERSDVVVDTLTRNVLFQSTLPREERHGGVLSALQPYIFQSTLPREERPLPIPGDIAIPKISIHAPTRGATALCCCQGLVSNISIHAPTRGATFIRIIFNVIFTFQSTLPREERPITA